MAMMVHDTQITLSTCVSLLRRLLVPLDCLLVVHVHALALNILAPTGSGGVLVGLYLSVKNEKKKEKKEKEKKEKNKKKGGKKGIESKIR